MIRALHANLRFLLFVSLTFLAACSSTSGKLNKELKTVSSWASTSRMVGEALMNGKVPMAYAKRTLETAQQKLQDESKTFSNSTDIPNERRTNVQGQINRIQQLVNQMKTAVEGNDKAALSQSIGQLMIEEQSMKSSIKNSSGQR